MYIYIMDLFPFSLMELAKNQNVQGKIKLGQNEQHFSDWEKAKQVYVTFYIVAM